MLLVRLVKLAAVAALGRIATLTLSDFVELELLDHMLGTAAWTSPTNVYVSLHTADPGETGANEVTGGSYGRQVAAFNVAAAGLADNAALIEFTDMPATTVTHVGIWDAVSAGNFLVGGALAASKTTNAGDTFQIAAGDLDVTLD